MHAAWRKRAEEAESQLAEARAEVEKMQNDRLTFAQIAIDKNEEWRSATGCSTPEEAGAKLVEWEDLRRAFVASLNETGAFSMRIVRQFERERGEGEAKITRLTANLAEWRDYWGCESPHDSHIQIGSSERYARQLGKEQARANTAENKLDKAEREIKELREALEKQPCRCISYPWSKCERCTALSHTPKPPEQEPCQCQDVEEPVHCSRCNNTGFVSRTPREGL